MKAVCGEYRAHNADVYMREDCDIDDLVDVIEGSRIYIPCIYAVNKIVRAPLIPPLKLVLAASFPAARFASAHKAALPRPWPTAAALKTQTSYNSLAHNHQLNFAAAQPAPVNATVHDCTARLGAPAVVGAVECRLSCSHEEDSVQI